MRDKIAKKALINIDECYPDDSSHNELQFPVASFIDESARRVINAVPLHSLGRGQNLITNITQHRPLTNGSGIINLPVDFKRLVSFKMEGWHRPVTEPIRASHPLYQKQFNPITRGGVAKPVVAIVSGDTQLEYYSVPKGTTHKIEEARYFGFSSVDSNYPPALIDITAWQVADLVFSSMNQVEGITIAQNKIAELVQTL